MKDLKHGTSSAVDRDQLLSVFNRYAQHEHDGERYMTPNEFLQDYLGYLKGDQIDPKTLEILSSLVDLNKDQSIRKSIRLVFSLTIVSIEIFI